MSTITAQAVKDLREVTGVGMMECKKALVETNGDIEAAKDLLRQKGQAKALKKSSRDTPEGAIGLHIADDAKSGGIIKIACETDFVARNENFQKFLQTLSLQVSTQGDQGFMEQAVAGTSGTVTDLVNATVGELGENIRPLKYRQLSVESGAIGGYVHSTGKVGVLVKLAADGNIDAAALSTLCKDISMHVTATHAEAIDESEISPDVLEKERSIFVEQARQSGKPDNIIEKMIEGRMKKFVKEVCILSQAFVKNPEKTISDLLADASQEHGCTIQLVDYAKFEL